MFKPPFLSNLLICVYTRRVADFVAGFCTQFIAVPGIATSNYPRGLVFRMKVPRRRIYAHVAPSASISMLPISNVRGDDDCVKMQSYLELYCVERAMLETSSSTFMIQCRLYVPLG